MGLSYSVQHETTYTMYVAVLPSSSSETLLEYYGGHIGTSMESGLDLPLPQDLPPQEENSTVRVGLGVVIQLVHNATGKPAPWQLVSRSSISKTRYRLANGIGIMDQTYTGETLAALDTRGQVLETTPAGTRLVQAVTPDLSSPNVQLCTLDDIESYLEEKLPLASRGSGGFGSTGI
jgi:dUTPase